MSVAEWIWIVLACVAVVAVYLAADHLGNRWWQALPPEIRERGLIRWMMDRRRN